MNNVKGVKLRGQLNVASFAMLLNLDETDKGFLISFLRKHKTGQVANRQELTAAAKAFMGLVDADPQTTSAAATMLRRVSAEADMPRMESVSEGIRVAKEGIEECWEDMEDHGMAQDNAGEQMTVSISMPGKNISVTTDSAEEIGNILRLAGINIGGQVAGDIDSDGDHDMADHAAEVGAEAPGEEQVLYIGSGGNGDMPAADKSDDAEEEEIEDAPAEPEEEEKEDEPKESKKPDADKDGVPDWADKKDDDEDTKNESADILRLAGVTQQAPAHAVEEDSRSTGDDFDGKEIDYDSLEIDGVNTSDHPDYTDAYFSAGSFKDGTPMSDQELESLTSSNGDIVNQMAHDSLHGMGESQSNDILRLSGVNEWANSPEGKTADKGRTFDALPSAAGKGAGHKAYGQNRANGQGENPMGAPTSESNVEEAFANAMSEYRKFVAETTSTKK